MRHYEVRVSYDNTSVWGEDWKWGDWRTQRTPAHYIVPEVRERINKMSGGEFMWGEFVYNSYPVLNGQKHKTYHVFTFLNKRAAIFFKLRYGMVDTE